jgi:hypothetical protein
MGHVGGVVRLVPQLPIELQGFANGFLSPGRQRGRQRALANAGPTPLQEANMPLRRKLLLIGAPIFGAAAIGSAVAFSMPTLAASPSPSPPASSSPSTTAPATPSSPGAPAQGGSGTHHCPNM